MVSKRQARQAHRETVHVTSLDRSGAAPAVSHTGSGTRSSETAKSRTRNRHLAEWVGPNRSTRSSARDIRVPPGSRCPRAATSTVRRRCESWSPTRGSARGRNHVTQSCPASEMRRTRAGTRSATDPRTKHVERTPRSAMTWSIRSMVFSTRSCRASPGGAGRRVGGSRPETSPRRRSTWRRGR